MTPSAVDRTAMARALALAAEAAESGEVPVGAVVIDAAGAIVAVVALTAAGQVVRFRRYHRDPADPRPMPLPVVVGTAAMIVIAAAAYLMAVAFGPG